MFVVCESNFCWQHVLSEMSHGQVMHNIQIQGLFKKYPD